jgi:uncharacterized protein (TIGR02391 family)
LLTLEVEEVAGVLLSLLNSGDARPVNAVLRPNKSLNLHNFFNRAGDYSNRPPFGAKQDQVDRALMEAWAWLESEALLVRDPGQGSDWYFVSRRGQRLKSREDLSAYRKASLLPKHQVHPLIAATVLGAFLRGDYDSAIFQAFKEIEVTVKKSGTFPDDPVGAQLMRKAFAPAKEGQTPGPLTDTSLPFTEQEAIAHLFAGAFGFYRNSTGHRHVGNEAAEAAEIIMFASQLLRVVDRAQEVKQ